MRKILIISLLVLLLPVSAFAGGEFTSVWSSTQSCAANAAGATYNAFGGAVPMGGMVPVIRTANITSDAASFLTLYSENGDSTTTDASSAASQKLLNVTATTSFQDDTAGAGSVVAIIDKANRVFEINQVSSITAGQEPPHPAPAVQQ